jgi:hypothetical protein
VVIYWFSVRDADGSKRETTGRMALADDNSARAFGKAMIRDMMRGDSTYTIRAGRGHRPARAPGLQSSLPTGTNPDPVA